MRAFVSVVAWALLTLLVVTTACSAKTLQSTWSASAHVTGISTTSVNGRGLATYASTGGTHLSPLIESPALKSTLPEPQQPQGDGTHAVDRILQFLLWSVIATDREQTAQWIQSTEEHPVTIKLDDWVTGAAVGSNQSESSSSGSSSSTYQFVCECLYEGNPNLAGQPEVLDRHFDWWAQAVDMLPSSFGASWYRLAAIAGLLYWTETVVSNNQITRDLKEAMVGAEKPWSEYAMLEYRITF